MTEDALSRAQRLAAHAAEREPGEIRPWDTDAPVADRARAHLELDPSVRIWVVAPSQPAAKRWLSAAGISGGRANLVQRSTNLHGLGAGAFVVILPGADLHPEWRSIKRQLAHLAQQDGIVAVVDEVDDLEHVGGVLLEYGNRIRPFPARPGRGDEFVIAEDINGRPLAILDRVAAEQLRRILDAYLNGEPMPDPAREAAERIRREIEETGDLYGRAIDEEAT